MGFPGIIFFKMALILAIFYFMDRRLRVWRASVLERLLFLGMAFLAAWPFWVERADLSSMALLSALFFEIDRRSADPKGSSPRIILWMALFALWANTHGAFPMGLFVIGLRGLFQIPKQSREAKRTIVWVLGCTMATFFKSLRAQTLASYRARHEWTVGSSRRMDAAIRDWIYIL